MPSRQWYPSAKQPPGQRRFGAPRHFMSSTNCFRMPSTFGIFESRPTQMPS